MQEMILELVNIILTAGLATVLAFWMHEISEKRNDHDEQDRDR